VGFEKVLFLKQKLRESIRKNYSPPQSLILEGTILGDNSALTEDLKNKLNITGLRHIIAVSGTHIVILSAILMSALLALGLWRGQAFYFSVVSIWLYIFLTGLPASGVRAGIMATLFLLAQKIGRLSHTERIIVMAGAVMLFLNPLLLFYDVGFQLSFLAVMGLIYLGQPIKDFLNAIWGKFTKKENQKKENSGFDNLLNIFSATISAQIFTLPIMMYNFGNVSLVSLLTNILVLPVVEWLMIFGFLSSFAGIFSVFLSWIFFIPCYCFLSYFVFVIEFFSRPWAIKTFENVHWIWLAISYILIGFLVNYIKRKSRQKFLGY
jgi:competence protein ComEC